MENEQNERKRPITYWIGEGAGWLLRHVVSGLAATGITPNMFTFLGLAVNSWAAALFAMGNFRQAAAVLFLAGFLDMADGQVARRVGRVTAFGAFLDSTLDRYSDLALYMGLVVYYTLIGRSFYMALAAVAMASSFMVSYSRARAESLIPSCKVGFMERPERLVLLIMGGAFNRMAQVLWVIATISTITVIHRVVYTWQELRAGRALPDASATRFVPQPPRISLHAFSRILAQRFFHRRGHDFLHALAKCVHFPRAICEVSIVSCRYTVIFPGYSIQLPV